MADDESVFPGFWHPDEQQGYTQLPHELIELLPKLGETELKIILYIFRHTWGFQEFGGFKKITIDEFMYGRKQRKIGDDGEEIMVRMDNGTGLSDWGVKDGIDEGGENLLKEVEAQAEQDPELDDAIGALHGRFDTHESFVQQLTQERCN